MTGGNEKLAILRNHIQWKTTCENLLLSKDNADCGFGFGNFCVCFRAGRAGFCCRVCTAALRHGMRLHLLTMEDNTPIEAFIMAQTFDMGEEKCPEWNVGPIHPPCSRVLPMVDMMEQLGQDVDKMEMPSHIHHNGTV